MAVGEEQVAIGGGSGNGGGGSGGVGRGDGSNRGGDDSHGFRDAGDSLELLERLVRVNSDRWLAQAQDGRRLRPPRHPTTMVLVLAPSIGGSEGGRWWRRGG